MGGLMHAVRCAQSDSDTQFAAHLWSTSRCSQFPLGFLRRGALVLATPRTFRFPGGPRRLQCRQSYRSLWEYLGVCQVAPAVTLSYRWPYRLARAGKVHGALG